MGDKKDKDKGKSKKKGFFGKMFGGDEPPESAAPTLPALANPADVQTALAAGPAEKVLTSLRDKDTPGLRKALLAFAAATPGNTKAVDKIRLEKGEIYVGSWSLSDMLHKTEGSHRPRPVREGMGVDRESWEAACRLTTILIQVLAAVGEPT